MKDDYLWDGSGEPDPEIEHLEKVLGRYRYQPKPVGAAFDQQLLPRRARFWPKLAVAAAIILMALAGVWIVRHQQKSAQGSLEMAVDEKKVQPQEQPKPDLARQDAPEPKPLLPRMKAPVSKGATVAKAAKRERKPVTPEFEHSSEVATVQPLMNPFVDLEVARHIERAQMLLRSFRNTRDAGDLDVAYERQRSRTLLSQNAVLRRGAEAKGNMPVGELLGSVEPFLLDIANLPDKPDGDDVRSIKARMQKKEIIAALQIYSAPTLSQAF
ncbi:MAG: hypothetical protein WBV94_09560 [Blastocatellia bacterium]